MTLSTCKNYNKIIMCEFLMVNTKKNILYIYNNLLNIYAVLRHLYYRGEIS